MYRRSPRWLLCECRLSLFKLYFLGANYNYYSGGSYDCRPVSVPSSSLASLFLPLVRLEPVTCSAVLEYLGIEWFYWITLPSLSDKGQSLASTAFVIRNGSMFVHHPPFYWTYSIPEGMELWSVTKKVRIDSILTRTKAWRVQSKSAYKSAYKV